VPKGNGEKKTLPSLFVAIPTWLWWLLDYQLCHYVDTNTNSHATNLA